MSNQSIQQHFKSLEPNQRFYLQNTIPFWLSERAIYSQIERVTELYTSGKVVLAAYIQANGHLFDPLESEDYRGEIVYDPHGLINESELLEVATKLFSLKNSKPDNSEEIIISDYLKKETVVVFDHDVPKSISKKPLKISSMWFFRKHLPNNHLAMQTFPILYSKATQGRVTLLPARFWSSERYEAWLEHARSAHDGMSFDVMPSIIKDEKVRMINSPYADIPPELVIPDLEILFSQLTSQHHHATAIKVRAIVLILFLCSLIFIYFLVY